jgi:hypothetical protein
LQAGRLRSSQPFRNFVALLELLSAQENRNNPAKQIAVILENGYEHICSKLTRMPTPRTEDIKGLSLYAQRYESTETFLSELALPLD